MNKPVDPRREQDPQRTDENGPDNKRGNDPIDRHTTQGTGIGTVED